MEDKMQRHIDLEGGYNIRDLGGYPTEDGRLTQPRVLIRAGSLDKLSAAAQQQFVAYGVRTVIDLRDELEAEAAPNVFAGSDKVTYLSLPLVGSRFRVTSGWKASVENFKTMKEFYTKFLKDCQPQISGIVTAVIENPSATVFHCYAGKDRTGVIAALLLGAVGVSDHAIAEDYGLTSQHITHLVQEWRENALREGRGLEEVERDALSEPATMLAILSDLRTEYGGATGYLQFCGISDNQLAQLRSRFVR